MSCATGTSGKNACGYCLSANFSVTEPRFLAFWIVQCFLFSHRIRKNACGKRCMKSKGKNEGVYNDFWFCFIAIAKFWWGNSPKKKAIIKHTTLLAKTSLYPF
jgi:hypothetical protein